MKHLIYLHIIMTSVFISSCSKDEPTIKRDGWKPVYFNYNDSTQIKSESPKIFENIGKIVSQENFVFANEKHKGIHIIDISNQSEPKNISFINLPNNLNFIIKDKTMYADNGKNLFVIDILNIKSIKVIKMIQNVYVPDLKSSTPPSPGYFECVDPKKGIPYVWHKEILSNPLCRK